MIKTNVCQSGGGGCTVVLSSLHQSSALLLYAPEELVAELGIRLGMPWRISLTTPIRLQVPFSVCEDITGVSGIDDLEILLVWFVHEVMVIGFIPPRVHGGGVGKQLQVVWRRTEGAEPYFADLGDVLWTHFPKSEGRLIRHFLE